ncbi:MAG: tetratricopeptide repeat protein [Planctomycetota bacterium]
MRNPCERRRVPRAYGLVALLLSALLPACSSTEPLTENTRFEAAGRTAFDDGAQQPPSAGTLYAMARILEAQGKDAELEVVLEKILRMAPEFPPAYNDLARLQMRKGRTEDAIQTLLEGCSVAPNDPVLLNNIGMCWLVSGRYEEALDSFSRAAAADPRNGRYRANAATSLGMLGRYEEALSLFSQVVSESEAHHNLALLCEARGDNDRAAAEAKLAGAEDPPPGP